MSDQEGAVQSAREERQQQPRQGERQGGGVPRGERERGRRRHQQQPAQNQPRRAEQHQLPMDELRDLFVLFTEHGLTEFELEREGFRVHLGRNVGGQGAADSLTLGSIGHHTAVPVAPAAQAQPAPQPAPAQAAQAQPAPAEAAPAEEESLHVIVSPIVGTFYRSPSPTAEPFVRLGSHVDPDAVVCIIEAMKLMNEIQAETSGEIAKIYVENGQPVEYGQPLFGVKK